MSCVPPAPVALHRYCVVMKKYILFLVSLLFSMGTYAQTGWQLTTEDQQVQKLNAIESNEDDLTYLERVTDNLAKIYDSLK